MGRRSNPATAVAGLIALAFVCTIAGFIFYLLSFTRPFGDQSR